LAKASMVQSCYFYTGLNLSDFGKEAALPKKKKRNT
jgi:hypothetical protein